MAFLSLNLDQDLIAKFGLLPAAIFARLWFFTNGGKHSCFYTDKTAMAEFNVCKNTLIKAYKDLQSIGLVSISIEKTSYGHRKAYKIHTDIVQKMNHGWFKKCTTHSSENELPMVQKMNHRDQSRDQSRDQKSVCGASAQDTHENNNSTNQSNEKTITRKDVETAVREYLSRSECPKKEWNNPESINLITVTIANWIIQKKAQVKDLPLFVENAILTWKGIETALNKSQRQTRKPAKATGFGSRSSDQIEDDVNQAEEQMKRILSQMNQSNQNDEVITDAEIVGDETPLLSASSNSKQTYYFN